MQTDQLIAKLQEIGCFTVTGTTNSWSSKILAKHPDILNAVYEATAFLPEDSKMSQRFYCIRSKIIKLPCCKQCNNPVKFNNTTGYASFCSPKCSNKSEDTKRTVRENNNRKYGCHPRALRTVQQKAEDTMLARYGGSHTLSSPMLREKIKQTNRQRYGQELAQFTEQANLKRKATNVERYGVEYLTKSSSIQAKIANTVFARYGVTSTSQLSSIKNQQAETKLTNLIGEANSLKLNDPEWLRMQHWDNNKSCTAIARELSLKDEQSIVARLRKFDIPINLATGSAGEQEIREFLINGGLQASMPTRTIIAPKELDIYVEDRKIAVEYHGLFWHSDYVVSKDMHYHRKKLELCNKQGIRLLSIFEDEWLDKQHIVKQKLTSIFDLPCDAPKIFARKCTISVVNTTDKRTFFDDNHIQGDGPSSINYGLYYNNELVACIAFIAKKDGVFILNRFATSTAVTGGFTKLLKHFQRNHKWAKIETFADLRWSEGDLYHKTGFVEEYTIPPDYYWTDGRHRFHKFGFRHKHLPKKLKVYDPELSEVENCHNNGLYRIYDCGKIKFSLTNDS